MVRVFDNEKSASWRLNLFENNYDVRRISSYRNLIRNANRTKKTKSHKEKGVKSTPVIDLLKLWSILIDDGDKDDDKISIEYRGISLKSLIYKEFGVKPIKWSEEISRTEEYRYQDVIYLQKLYYRFLEKIKQIEDLKNFSYNNWSFIKTPATFTKILYQNKFPKLKLFQEWNNNIIDQFNLKDALESAFHGGITLSMYRGELKEGFWFDIKGAYSKAIEVLNTDQYLQFNIHKINPDKINFISPFLLKCKVNFVLKSINKSLKMFYVKEPEEVWIWNYDIIACQKLITDFKYEIMEAYEIVPMIHSKQSLTVTWNNKKNEEKKKNGKTTLYEFYKFLSNTSYGIKAQRRPFVTLHTNMVIAGMITAKVHSVLCTMIEIARNQGYKGYYNDTDSYFGVGKYTDELFKKVNEAIKPFEIEYEGSYYKTIILSLKRYISLTKTGKDKVKLHGKGRYKIDFNDIKEYVLTKKIKEDDYLRLSQLSANTELGVKMILNLFPFLDEYKHPFMFVKNIQTNVLKSEFMNEWYNHIDTKTTWKKKQPFERQFHKFESVRYAEMFFQNYKNTDNQTGDDLICDFRNWDNEIVKDFKIK